MSETTAPPIAITEFLTARLDEDEAVALAVDEQYRIWRARKDYIPQLGIFFGRTQAPGYIDPADAAHIMRHDPASVLADIEAKRAVIELHKRVECARGEKEGCEHCGWDDDCRDCYGYGYPCHTVALLALPYKDHPDYDPAWLAFWVGEPATAAAPPVNGYLNDC